jgi:hypothetical protein
VVFWPPHSSRPTQARHSSDRGYRTNRVPASVILPTDYTTGTSGTIDTPDPLKTTIAAGKRAGSERIAALYCYLCPQATLRLRGILRKGRSTSVSGPTGCRPARPGCAKSGNRELDRLRS